MMRSMMLLLLALVTGSACLAATQRDFSVGDLRLAGCRIEGGRVVLDRCFDQGTSPALAVEAEEALNLIADPPTGQADAACSGGKCLVRLDRALLPLSITRPGRYTRYVRGYFPKGGGWVHSESLDHGNAEWYTDCDGLTAGRWVWVKGPTYDLTAGTHLLWLHNWHGGALLDKIALLPEGSPEPSELGPAATGLAPARQGWVSTGVLSVPGLSKLLTARWPAEERGGSVATTLSLDGGRSYLPLDAQTLTQAVQAPIARLVLRAELRAAPGGASPSVGTPQVTYETDSRAFVALENEQVKATFLRPTGALIGLHDKLAKTDSLTAVGVAPPFALRHLPAGAGKPVAIPDDQIKLLDLATQGSSLVARYRVANGIGVRVTATLSGGQITWACVVDNQSKLDIVEVVCPLLPGVRMGQSSADDLLMTPNWQGGVETSEPVKTGGDGLRYPTGGAMCWFDLYERSPRPHGVYLSGHDQSLLGCALQATADPASDSLTFSMTKFARVPPGNTWTAPPVVLGVHQGDWHVAADAYRTWAQGWMRKPTPPEWVREADGWFGLVTSADGSHIPFRQMPEYLKSARELGTNYIQVWGQMTGGNNCDALPYPNPVLGSLEEFKAAVAEVRRWGGHITFYVSSQFWRVDYGDEPMLGSTPRSLLPPGVPTWPWEEWINYALRGYDGSFSGDTELTETQQARYRTQWLRTIMCPFTEAWSKRHLQYWCVDQYARAYGASGIYLDETCAAGERVCAATGHGHPHPGLWGSSLTRTMQDMVQGGRRQDPDWTFAMEGCGDAIGQFADMNLISPASAKKPGQWGANRRFAPECFHYTFPDYLLYDGVANGMYGKTQEDCFLDVHLHGNRYDSFSVSPAAPYVKLRQRTKQLLYRARFMDTVGVVTSDPGVRAKVNRLQDAGNDVRIVNLANPEHQTGATVTLDPPAGARPVAYMFDLEGKEGPVALTRTTSGVSFTAPSSRAATVVVATRCEPLVRVPVVTLAAGDNGALEVSLTNLMPQAVDAAVSLGEPLPGVAVAPVKLALPAQATVTVKLPLALPANAQRRCHDTHVIVKTQGQTVRRPAQVLVVSPFTLSASLAGRSVRVVVRNQSQSSQSGELTVSGTLWAKPVAQTVQMAPGAEATLLLPLAQALADPITVQARLRSGGQTETHDLIVRPLVVNGGFEQKGSANRPASWSFQQPEFASMSGENPASGQACLQLTGRPGVFVEADQMIPVVAGQTYEARCAMRRTAGQGARVQPAVVMFMKTGPEQYAYLDKVTDKADDQWNDYAAKFVVGPDVARVAFYLYNVDSTATAWFDEVRVAPLDKE